MTRRTRIRPTLVSLAALLLLSLLAPAAGAQQATNQEFRASHRSEPDNRDCARGTFVANGVIDDSGVARICARRFRSNTTASGTQVFVGSKGRYTLNWKSICELQPGGDRLYCTGQWVMDGPLEGQGNLVHVLTFGPDGYTVDARYTGTVH